MVCAYQPSVKRESSTFLARSHWGGAYNAEVKRLMLQHAFRFVSRVIFVVGTTNVRSQRALEKIGAVRVATRTGTDGHDKYVFQMRRNVILPTDAAPGQRSGSAAGISDPT